LFALDADEILTADSVHNIGWQTMRESQPGTVLYFEKPDLYITPYQVIRYSLMSPFAYVDDGVEHTPLKIHSVRIPNPDYAVRLYLHDVKILHYSLTRIEAQNSKQKFYSMLENIYKKNHFLARRKVYAPNFDYVNSNKVDITPQKWFEGWEKLGIDMKTIQSSRKFWYSDEALKLFSQHGYKKFWMDSLAKQSGGLIPVKKPPYLLQLSLKILDRLYKKVKK